MTFPFYFLAIVIGIITGVITGLIGASGVMIIVPILTLIFKVNVHTAIGTSLLWMSLLLYKSPILTTKMVPSI